MQYRVATKADAEAIRAVTNEAFMADAFFKLPEYHLRFTAAAVDELMSAPRSVFIVAVSPDGAVRGSIHLEWQVEEEQTVGHFSAVSVLRAFEKQGVGRGLVRAAEEYLLALDCAATSVVIEMGVINLRADLFPFYEKQGYNTGARLPHTDELARICLPELDVFLVQMAKRLR